MSIEMNRPKEIVADILAKGVKIENIVFVGCGASMAESYPGRYFLESCAKKLRIFHYTASEFNWNTPAWLGDTSVVISVSMGGNTPETVQANSVAKAAGATVISVTHVAGPPLTKEAHYCVIHDFETNYAAKLERMGYTMALALELLQQTEGYEHYDKMLDGFAKIFDLAESSAQASRRVAREFAKEYQNAPVIYVMSSGASTEVAYSTSVCMLMEMQWIHSGNCHSGEFFHGPFEIVEKDVPFLLLMNDGRTRAVDSRALTFLHRFQAKTTVIDAKDYGLSSVIDGSVATFFNPLLHTAVYRVFEEELANVREHPLTKRRYMWKLEY